MPDKPVTPTAPRCPACGAVGTVKRETTIKGVTATQLWKCSRCGHVWPAKEFDAA